MDQGAIAIIIILSIGALMIGALIYWVMFQKKQNADTQREISDRDLLRLLASQPDGLLSPHQLADQSGLTLNQARTRLSALMMYGILERSHNRRARYFYGLQDPLEEAPDLALSPAPFLTVEDLLNIFRHYNYRVSPQNLIMATGLPLAIIKREMKHFEAEGIVQKLQRVKHTGSVMESYFVLQEPYRSDPEQFRARAGTLDLEMREILRNDNLIL